MIHDKRDFENIFFVFLKNIFLLEKLWKLVSLFPVTQKNIEKMVTQVVLLFLIVEQ
jgi:hypothetical protein